MRSCSTVFCLPILVITICLVVKWENVRSSFKLSKVIKEVAPIFNSLYGLYWLAAKS